MRSPHEATCRSIASRSHRRTHHVVVTTISLEKLARLSARRSARADRCPHRRGLRRRSAADSRRDATCPCATPAWAAELAGQSAVVVCQKGAKLSEGVAAWLRHAGVPADVARRRLRGLDARPACRWSPPPRCRRATRRPHRLGDARAAQDRPHRLPLADPPLRRSGRRVPVRGAVGGRRRSPSASTRRRSTSRACSGAIAARPAPST